MAAVNVYLDVPDFSCESISICKTQALRSKIDPLHSVKACIPGQSIGKADSQCRKRVADGDSSTWQSFRGSPVVMRTDIRAHPSVVTLKTCA